jgi:hypothetical protein
MSQSQDFSIDFAREESSSSPDEDEETAYGALGLVKNNKVTLQRFEITKNPFIIGNLAGCDLLIKNNDEIGPKHVKIFKKNSDSGACEVFIVPFSEKNYVTVGDKKVVKNTRLKKGDLIQIGPASNCKKFAFLEFEDQQVDITSSPNASSSTTKKVTKRRKVEEDLSLIEILARDFEQGHDSKNNTGL